MPKPPFFLGKYILLHETQQIFFNSSSPAQRNFLCIAYSLYEIIFIIFSIRLQKYFILKHLFDKCLCLKCLNKLFIQTDLKWSYLTRFWWVLRSYILRILAILYIMVQLFKNLN